MRKKAFKDILKFTTKNYDAEKVAKLMAIISEVASNKVKHNMDVVGGHNLHPVEVKKSYWEVMHSNVHCTVKKIGSNFFLDLMRSYYTYRSIQSGLEHVKKCLDYGCRHVSYCILENAYDTVLYHQILLYAIDTGKAFVDFEFHDCTSGRKPKYTLHIGEVRSDILQQFREYVDDLVDKLGKIEAIVQEISDNNARGKYIGVTGEMIAKKCSSFVIEQAEAKLLPLCTGEDCLRRAGSNPKVEPSPSSEAHYCEAHAALEGCNYGLSAGTKN